MVTGFPVGIELGELLQGAGPDFKVSAGELSCWRRRKSTEPTFASWLMHWPRSYRIVGDQEAFRRTCSSAYCALSCDLVTASWSTALSVQN